MQKGILYISIPITGKDYLKQQKEAEMWQSHHERLGYNVINPFDLGKKLERRHQRLKLPMPTHAEYMEIDLKAMEKCTHIFFCEGWSKSKGCMMECDKAIELGLLVDTYIRPR
jgi:Domain of unknown function (DUF4406)